MPPKVLRSYVTEKGVEPFREWLQSLKDKGTVARVRARLERVELGNFGDAKSVGSGVSELRFSFGSGYRVYFGQDGDEIVILLAGGDKASQSKDILMAQRYWNDYLKRCRDGEESK